MATRLYPLTKNPASLETLAGVPAGTMEKLNAIRAKHTNADGALNYDGFYDDVYTLGITPDVHLGRLDSFLNYGWGRVSFGFLESMGFDPVSDQCTDIGIAKSILIYHGESHVDPYLTEGLCWS